MPVNECCVCHCIEVGCRTRVKCCLQRIAPCRTLNFGVFDQRLFKDTAEGVVSKPQPSFACAQIAVLLHRNPIGGVVNQMLLFASGGSFAYDTTAGIVFVTITIALRKVVIDGVLTPLYKLCGAFGRHDPCQASAIVINIMRKHRIDRAVVVSELSFFANRALLLVGIDDRYGPVLIRSFHNG